jgi:hypothetical protein
MKLSNTIIIWALALILAALAAAETLFAAPHHPVFPWHNWPGFMALLGLGSCLVVVKLSKLLGKWLLQRPEEYDA